MTNEEMLLNTLTKSGWIVTDQKDDNGATVVVADDKYICRSENMTWGAYDTYEEAHEKAYKFDLEIYHNNERIY